jgi:anti-sigma B factor antagonist
MSASFDLVEDGAFLIGKLEGDIDLATARELSSEILRGVPTDARGLVLDLSAVRYLDSTGVSMLLDLHRSLEAKRQRLGVVLPSTSHLWRLFEVTGLRSILHMGGTLAEAKAAAEER